MNNIFREPSLQDVKRLLSDNELPVEDLAELEMSHFFGCGEASNPQGVIGVEVYGSDGLLRSLAVSTDVRGDGCGSALLSELEEYSKGLGIKTLYLLTETAESYFERKGFEKIGRELASESIRQTREFSGICPDSATLMRKVISD